MRIIDELPAKPHSRYEAVRRALAAQRCVILDGRPADDPATWTRMLVEAPDEVRYLHRRFVDAGCDVITTGTSLGAARSLDAHWMELARRGVRLAREAAGEHEVAVAFALDADADAVGQEGPETFKLLARALAPEPPDLLIVEALSVVRPALYAAVRALVETGIPLWLSFRRCRQGLCGVHGQHWGGPEGDDFGRAALRLEELGAQALLVGGIPPEHVHGMVAYLRDFTDLPLGVHPNLGYRTHAGWELESGVAPQDYAHQALAWRDEGAQIIGGASGVGAEHMAAAAVALAHTRPGPPRGPAPTAAAPAPEPWRDEDDRPLYPLAFPDLAGHGEVFAPTQGSFLLWRHLFQQRIGQAARCLDIGCGSGLQAVQLALNGAREVHAIDIEPEAVALTQINAFRNGVADRVEVEAADLFGWRPAEPFDVVVASLYQLPVDPRDTGETGRPADYWGRSAVDHVLRALPHMLTPFGVAYLLHLSILSQQRTAQLLERHGLRARVADFAFFEFGTKFAHVERQIGHVERISDAHHLRVAGTDVAVAYLLEITRTP